MLDILGIMVKCEDVLTLFPHLTFRLLIYLLTLRWTLDSSMATYCNPIRFTSLGSWY